MNKDVTLFSDFCFHNILPSQKIKPLKCIVSYADRSSQSCLPETWQGVTVLFPGTLCIKDGILIRSRATENQSYIYICIYNFFCFILYHTKESFRNLRQAIVKYPLFQLVTEEKPKFKKRKHFSYQGTSFEVQKALDLLCTEIFKTL